MDTEVTNKMNNHKRDWVIDKLERLVKLCKATEPDQPDDTSLFTPNTIDAHDLLNKVEEYNMSNSDLVEIMSEANRIWKIRRKIFIPPFIIMVDILGMTSGLSNMWLNHLV